MGERSCTMRLSISMGLLYPHNKKNHKKNSGINHGFKNLDILLTSSECSIV